MDVRQLRYFQTIAKEKQISRAAKRLHMAQPPLSQQLKTMEQELGVKLVERNGRSIELTPAGKLLYERAETLLRQFDETIREVKETGDGVKGVLSLGSAISSFSYLLERVRYFREHYPNVIFRLRESDTFRLVQSLENREIELAIVQLPLDLDDFYYICLPTEPFVFVMPKKWATNPAQMSISMQEIAEYPLLLMRRLQGKGMNDVIIEEFKRHGYTPNIACECPDAAMLLWLVSAGVGATILPKSALLTLPTPELKIMDIDDSPLQSELAVIWLKDRYLSKSAMHFIDTFRSESAFKGESC
ncbi:LysR family transcriptional regulator [Fictibacillus gelatini]|uniref:LysR family transcriptional regulator n=1 Tax=Fictibacillus gelatini TaxID=225985 RepID=UPI0004144632|nr:LysR family transcriptional regulator [Fictibacillus gelatini]